MLIQLHEENALWPDFDWFCFSAWKGHLDHFISVNYPSPLGENPAQLFKKLVFPQSVLVWNLRNSSKKTWLHLDWRDLPSVQLELLPDIEEVASIRSHDVDRGLEIICCLALLFQSANLSNDARMLYCWNCDKRVIIFSLRCSIFNIHWKICPILFGQRVYIICKECQRRDFFALAIIWPFILILSIQIGFVQLSGPLDVDHGQWGGIIRLILSFKSSVYFSLSNWTAL